VTNPAATKLRRLALQQERYRSIVIDAGPSHPEFGWAFTRAYLPSYTKHPATRLAIPPCNWHGDLDRVVYGGLGRGGARVVLAPRGFAKSVKASLVLPLAAVALKLKQYVLIVSDSGPQARQHMQAVVQEIATNEALARDFGHLKAARDHRGRTVSEKSDDLILASGARIQALGAGAKFRGRRQGEFRPDLCVIDDLEHDEAVATKYQRDKLDDWLSSALLGALGVGADTYMMGTLLHFDAVLARLMRRSGWEAHRYDAVTDALDFTTTQWPSLWPAERLEQTRQRMGSLAFAREFLHQPHDDSTAIFRREWLRFRDTRTRLLEAEPGSIPARVRVSVDPAISQKQTADFSAIVTVAQVGHSKEVDVLEAWHGRVTGKQLAHRVAQEVDRWRGYGPVVCAESIAAQAWLAQALREDHGLAVKEIRPTRDKVQRAEPTAVRFEGGQVWLSPHLEASPLVDELLAFPSAPNDDLVDALTQGVDDLTTGYGTLRIEVL
jgi:phage terminase large subunit-like protein